MTARLITVTLGSGATQISSTHAYFNHMLVQNSSASDTCQLGDSTVTSSTGITLAGANAVNSTVTIGPFSGQQGDASQYYLYGTSGQKAAVLLT